MKILRCFLPASLLAALSVFAPLMPLKGQDINLTGYTLTFDEEFNSVSWTDATPKGSYTWRSLPCTSDKYIGMHIRDQSCMSISNGTLVNTLKFVPHTETSGAYCAGVVGMKDGSGTALISVGTLGTQINSHSGFMWGNCGLAGMKFMPSSNVTISQLGRYNIAGSTGNSYCVRILNATDCSDVARAVINLNGQPTGWVYAPLVGGTNVILTGGQTYYLMYDTVGFYNGNYVVDSWYDGNTTVTASGGITVNESEWGTWNAGSLCSVDSNLNGFTQQWGYFEARVQMPPGGSGVWPSFCTYSKPDGSSPLSEESDIFEYYGGAYDNNTDGGFGMRNHNWGSGPAEQGVDVWPASAKPWLNWHIYGYLATPTYCYYYVDGVQQTQWATPTDYITNPSYISLEYNIGGWWPQTNIIANSQMLVDWVRVYSLPIVIPNENTISINLAGSNTSQQLQPAAVAGAPGYTGSNWNVFTGANNTTPTLLKNAAGSTAAGVTMESFSSVMAYLINSGSNLTPDEELFAAVIQSYSAGTPTVSVSAIPYSDYAVVVYLESDSAGRTGSVSVSGSPVTYYYSTVGGGGQPASYIQVTSTTAGTYTTGNYVVFTGLSGSSQTITLSETTNAWSGMCGVQIVPPASQMSYSQWASQYFTTANPSSGEAAVPMNDGVANLLKYLCDINPVVPMTASTRAALPAGGMTSISGSFYLTLTYRASQSETGVTLNVQTSPDLQTWQTVTPSSIVTTGTDAATGDPLIQFQVPINSNDVSKEFIRLNLIGL